MYKPKKVVITGGPSTGKTSTLSEMEARGISVAHEQARLIIDSKQFNLDTQWDEFQYALVHAQMAAESTLSLRGETVFCDRGVFDSVAYCAKKGRTPKFLLELETPRYSLAFVLEHLGFFEQDATRREDLAFTKAITPLLSDAYESRGVKVYRVPAWSVDERVDFILKKCAEHGVSLPLVLS